MALAQSNTKILIIGDSLSAAYGIKVQESWPNLLQESYKNSQASVQIINASISGETTFGGKDRAAELLNKYRPNILILELGGNDGLRGLNLALSQQNLESIISLAKQQNTAVLLVGVRLPPNLGKRYNAKFQSMYQSISNKMQTQYLAKFLQGVAEHRHLMQQDGIHPTAEAQPFLQKKVESALDSMIENAR